MDKVVLMADLIILYQEINMSIKFYVSADKAERYYYLCNTSKRTTLIRSVGTDRGGYVTVNSTIDLIMY